MKNKSKVFFILGLASGFGYLLFYERLPFQWQVFLMLMALVNMGFGFATYKPEPPTKDDAP
jgi:hypothetical protein